MPSKPTHFERRIARRGIGGTGRIAEKKAAGRLAGKLRPASGAKDGYKGDIVLPDYLCENKSTQAGSLGLKYEWLVKISKEAACDDKVPALTLQFTSGNGTTMPHGAWVCIPEALFQELCNARPDGV